MDCRDADSLAQSGLRAAGPRISAAVSYIKLRLMQEASLLRQQWLMWVFCITIDFYGASMVFRNLAFYRYR